MAHQVMLVAMLLGIGAGALSQGARISVDPHTTRSIRGISELNRTKYFGLCDHGRDFDVRCRDDARYEYLVRENGITFGRKLGLITGPDRWGKAVREDAERPGYADLEFLAERLAANGHDDPSGRFRADMGGRLDVAAHGHHGGFPEWMGKWQTPEVLKDEKAREREWVPENLDAAAELAAAIMRHDFNDFDRPVFYEPVNEPHWSYWDEEPFQQWHLKIMNAVHAETPEVRVGGPCFSVPYFYGREYKNFDGLKGFIDGTKCAMDFYSFHVYDYLREDDGDFGGQITSGLPLESVLDLVTNHTVNEYGKEVSLVFSEHGGYGAGELVGSLANEHFPGDGFDWEMRKRTIDDFNRVSSVLANTLVFMDHPHVVAKAVPFILLEAMGWDPEYYAVLYAPRDFTDKTDWVPTQKIMFYRFLRDLKGRRVKGFCSDPDLQMRAFVDGSALQVVVNNLWTEGDAFSIDAPEPARVTLRRIGRRDDFTPYLVEEESASLDDIAIAGREAVLVRAEYDEPLEARQTVDEIPCYGDRIATAAADGEAAVSVSVPDADRLDYAVLRVGVSRPEGSDYRVDIALNGTRVETVVENCAPRIETEKLGYASCKIIDVPVELVEAENTVAVSFPDGKPGSVGAVVIRAGVRE